MILGVLVKKIGQLFVLFGAVMALHAPALAQTGPPPPVARSGVQQYNMTEYTSVNRPNARLVPRESGNPMQVRAAAKVAADLHAPCEVTDAAPLSNRPSSKPEYEIVCKDALGWIDSLGADGKPLLNDCLALDTAALAAGKAWPKGMVCSLPGNAAPVAGLKPLAAKASAGCLVADGTFPGRRRRPADPALRDRLQGRQGLHRRQPAPGSPAPLSALTCDEAKAAGAACTLADKKRG